MQLTEQQEAVQKLKNQHLTNRQIADRLGITINAVQKTHQRIRAKTETQDSPGVLQAAQDLGLDLTNLNGGWLKTENASLRFSVPKLLDDEDVTLNDVYDMCKENIAPLPIRQFDPRVSVRDDLLTKYVLADLHMGMKATVETTGNEYNVKIASELLDDAITSLVSTTPNSKTAILLNLGDLFHANDSSNSTPNSGHVLDVDGSNLEIAYACMAAIRKAIETLLTKHEKVIFGSIPGNHDRDQANLLLISIACLYADNPRVDVQLNMNKDNRVPSSIFKYRFGKNLFTAHHGDKTNFQRLYNAFTDMFRKDFGETDWHFCDTGHIHHQSEIEIGSMIFRSYRSLAGKDAYHAHAPYTAKRSMYAQTYHTEFGEIDTKKVNVCNGKVTPLSI